MDYKSKQTSSPFITPRPDNRKDKILTLLDSIFFTNQSKSAQNQKILLYILKRPP